MTAAEIRGVEIRSDAPDSETARNGVRMLREIAAQLAELNDNLKDKTAADRELSLQIIRGEAS